MKVAALQMVSGLRWADNLAPARGLLQQAADAGAELASATLAHLVKIRMLWPQGIWSTGC